MTTTIEHYSDCTAHAIQCAVENVRDMTLEFSYKDEADRIAKLTPAEFCNYLLTRAAEYQEDGLMDCSCAADRLKQANEALRLARKRDRAGLPSPVSVASLKATRDAIKAAL